VKSDRSAIAAAMASILLFATVNHISPASGKPRESRTEGVGIRASYQTYVGRNVGQMTTVSTHFSPSAC
jgi:hypothetical protein